MRTNFSLNFVLIAIFFLSVISCEKPDDSDKDPVVVIDDKDNVSGITLNTNSIEVIVGTYQLTAFIDPSTAKNKNVFWSSNNTEVATVDQNGLVTLKKLGSAVITAKTEDGDKTATCTINVVEEVTKVTGVTLNKTSISKPEGTTFQLTATVAPSNASNKSVLWSSNKTEVAEVNQNGLVTLKKVGTAVITAKTEDGDKTATCAINVVVDVTKVTGVTLNKSSIELDKGATYQLTATVAPPTAINRKVEWSSSNTSVATVDGNGLVRGVSKGNAIIKAKTEEGEFEVTCSVKINDSSAKTYKLTIDFPEVSSVGRNAVYVAWIENEGGENIQNLYICNTIKVDVAVNDKRLDGIALPYWRKEKISNTDFNNVDAITGASIQNSFNFSRSLDLGDETKFYVCFEIDRSENGNEYFVDRPCFIYRTEQIDLSNLKSSYELSLVAYMANDTKDSKYSQEPKKDIPGFSTFKYMEDVTYISPVNMFENETVDHSNLKVSVSEE